MIKKILSFLIAGCSLFLVSCLETEEKIVIKNDNSGDYFLTLDMGALIKMAKQMGKGSEKDNKIPDKKDSTLYFKSFVDTSTRLSADEKAMLRDGSLRMKIDEEKSEMRIVVNLPFKKIQDLPKLRETYMAALDKLGIMNKMDDKKDDGENPRQEIPSDMSSGTRTLNPGQNAYTFLAAPGKLSNKFTDKKQYEEHIMGDSSLQMMKNMGAMMGEMTYRTVIVLPKAVKNYKGSGAEISADKKTLTFKSNLSEFLEKPEAFEYELEY